MLSTMAYQQQTNARRQAAPAVLSLANSASPKVDHSDAEAQLAAIGSVLDRPAHCILFEEGNQAGTLYRIGRGVVMAYKLLPDGRRQVTGFLFHGDFLGLAHDGRYVYGAQAVTDCRVLAYPSGQFQRLLARSPPLERHMLRLANHELLAAQEQMMLLGRKTAEERLASLLCILARRQGERGEADNPVWLPMCRGSIADYLGLTLETVSRLFSKLSREGLISKLGKQFVRLEEPQRLAEVAAG